jgi:hypothetical protein
VIAIEQACPPPPEHTRALTARHGGAEALPQLRRVVQHHAVRRQHHAPKPAARAARVPTSAVEGAFLNAKLAALHCARCPHHRTTPSTSNRHRSSGRTESGCAVPPPARPRCCQRSCAWRGPARTLAARAASGPAASWAPQPAHAQARARRSHPRLALPGCRRRCRRRAGLPGGWRAGRRPGRRRTAWSCPAPCRQRGCHPCPSCVCVHVCACVCVCACVGIHA